VVTTEGILVLSGDFKLDQTPVDGAVTDLGRFAHYGEKGVLALFSDSTNVEKEGFTLSEKEVRKTLEGLFEQSTGRLIVAIFASNITRIQQVINLALKFGRRVIFSGKSMKANVRIAREEGLIQFPPDIEISEGAVDQVPDDRVVMITTGSQGEPMSFDQDGPERHKTSRSKGDDYSLRVYPGNERAITTVINSLYHGSRSDL
jgi:ribonuclease J